MKIRRLFAGALAGILAVGMLAGCSKAGSGEENESKGGDKPSVSNGGDAENVGGRYVEEDLKPPVQAGEKPLGAFEKDGILWMYTFNGDADSGQTYFSYQYKDGAWTGPQEETGMESVETENHIYFMKIVLGADGKLYALGTKVSDEEPYGSRILMQNEDGSSWSDMTPEALKTADSDGYAAMIPDLDVLSDGAFCVSNMMMDQIEIYRDGKKTATAETASQFSDMQESMCAAGDTLAVIGEDRKSIVFYQGSDMTQIGSFPLEEALGEENVALAGGKDGIWYYQDTKGIHRMQEGGSIVETVMDGSYGKMGNPECTGYAFYQNENGDFYSLFRNYGTGELSMCRYYFDEDTPSAADSTLTIYGLRESKTVEQAVSSFQNAHPEVKIEYSYSVGEYDAVTTEQIRTLNTQILSGDGPDLLILDGLPVSSYVEKGILADISDLDGKLREQGVLMDVIGNTAADGDGKMYGLPARIGVPIVFGSEEAAKALDGLDELEGYLANDPDGKLFNTAFHSTAGRVLFSSSYEELIQDGKLNQENLVRLFQCWKKICDNLDTKGLETFYEYDSSEEIADINTYFYSGNTGILRPDRITTEDLQGLITMMLPCYEMANAGLSPKAIQQYYIPYTVVGVNAASEQQEIAKEFLLTLFSDEVQKSQTNDGFPVTEGGLNSLAEYVETAEAKDIIIGSSMMDAESGEEVKIDIGYPDGETMKSYIEMIRNLEKPFLPDQVFLETVMDEMESCYEGNQTPEEAARAAAQKMDTYLSE